MQVSIEISLYPLDPNYETPILDFIRTLNAEPEIRVTTNQLSTQLTGEYDRVMGTLTDAMRPVLADETTCSFVLKILNVAIDLKNHD